MIWHMSYFQTIRNVYLMKLMSCFTWIVTRYLSTLIVNAQQKQKVFFSGWHLALAGSEVIYVRNVSTDYFF